MRIESPIRVGVRRRLIAAVLVGGLVAGCGDSGVEPVDAGAPVDADAAPESPTVDDAAAASEPAGEPWMPRGDLSYTSEFDDEDAVTRISEGTPVVVRGVLYGDFRGWQLCNGVQESVPPGCSRGIWLDLPPDINPRSIGKQGETIDSFHPDVPIVLGEPSVAIGVLTAPDRIRVASLAVDTDPQIGRPGRIAGGTTPVDDETLIRLGAELTAVANRLRDEGSSDPLAMVQGAGPLDGGLYVLAISADDALVEALEAFAPDIPLAIASIAEPAP